MFPNWVVFKKMQQKCDIGGQTSKTMNTLMKPMQFICGIIVFSEFSKFLSHMSHIFLKKIVNVTFSATFQYELCYNTLIIEKLWQNEHNVYCCLNNLTYTKDMIL